MTAADVIGKYLIAELEVPVSATPGGTPVGVVQKGIVVGPVYSWVEKNGRLYWMFDYTIPGQSPGAYYAEHRPQFWKLSATGAGGNSNVTITPGGLPKWAVPAGLAVLALVLLK
jgi:hypothetical protein